MLRRREMMGGEQALPILYKLEGHYTTSTTEQNRNTGVLLFDEPKSFSICCEVYVAVSGFNARQNFYGLGDNSIFRLGQKAATAKLAAYMGGQSVNVVVNPNTTSKAVFKSVQTYDHTTRTLRTIVKDPDGTLFSGNLVVSADVINNDPLRIATGGSRPYATYYQFIVYAGVLSGSEISKFLGGN